MGLIYRAETNFQLKGAKPVKLPLLLTGQEQITCLVQCKQRKKTWSQAGSLEQVAFLSEAAGMTTIRKNDVIFDENQLIDLIVIPNSFIVFSPVKWLVYRTNISIFAIDMPLYSIPTNGQSTSNSGRHTVVPLPTANAVVQILESDLDRDSLTLQNLGGRTVYVDFSNAVSTTSYSISIASGQAYEFPSAYTGALWAVSGTASQAINVVEML